eukprot:SAG31_NODE_4408_length_3258_cov_4.000633_1_plen_320_part_00
MISNASGAPVLNSGRRRAKEAGPKEPAVFTNTSIQVRPLKPAMAAKGKGTVKRYSTVDAVKALAAGRINLDEPFLVEGGLGAGLDALRDMMTAESLIQNQDLRIRYVSPVDAKQARTFDQSPQVTAFEKAEPVNRQQTAVAKAIVAATTAFVLLLHAAAAGDGRPPPAPPPRILYILLALRAHLTSYVWVPVTRQEQLEVKYVDLERFFKLCFNLKAKPDFRKNPGPGTEHCEQVPSPPWTRATYATRDPACVDRFFEYLALVDNVGRVARVIQPCQLLRRHICGHAVVVGTRGCKGAMALKSWAGKAAETGRQSSQRR